MRFSLRAAAVMLSALVSSFFGKTRRLLIFVVCLLTSLQSAHAEWAKYETDNFVLYSEKSDEESQHFLRGLELYRKFLIEVAQLQPRPGSLRLTIYFAKNKRSYHELTNSRGSLGIFMTSDEGPISVFYNDESPGQFKIDGEQILRHEYVHFLQFQSAPNRYPFWYQEGFAEYLSSVKYKDGAMWVGEILMARAAALHVSEWIYVRKLLEADRREWGKYPIYGQSWLLTHMLYTSEKYRHGRSNLLQLLADDVEPRAAIEKAFSVNYQTLDTDMRNYFKDGKFYSYQFNIEPPEIEIIGPHKLDSLGSKIIKSRAKLALSRSKKVAGRLVKDTQKALKKDALNHELREILLKAMTRAGDWPTAAKTAKEYLAMPQPLPATRAAAAEVLFRAEHQRLMKNKNDEVDENASQDPDLQFDPEFLKTVRQHLEAEISHNEQNARARMWHAGTYIYGGEKNFSAAANSITEAFVLYPQSWRIRRQYADLLYEDGEYQQACLLYVPLYRTVGSGREKNGIKLRLKELSLNHPECSVRELEESDDNE